ncbi:hypothetical protein VIGAN_01111100 [Vigna angularis var. angularis]|uniref:Uncharacterized protein n=1 Tax=Vigna angularis var. angularis TaxID=157739 RepID=A0A0S3QZ44_PHAAN|nr:hypothetical protein VIGAN_01111100 [Vigna angularis var. angularis]
MWDIRLAFNGCPTSKRMSDIQTDGVLLSRRNLRSLLAIAADPVSAADKASKMSRSAFEWAFQCFIQKAPANAAVTTRIFLHNSTVSRRRTTLFTRDVWHTALSSPVA